MAEKERRYISCKRWCIKRVEERLKIVEEYFVEQEYGSENGNIIKYIEMKRFFGGIVCGT